MNIRKASLQPNNSATHHDEDLAVANPLPLHPNELPPLSPVPVVSVLMTNHNYAEYIGEAIESALSQTYQNFELIICDDGSTDNSREVIKSYEKKDQRIKLLSHSDSLGYGAGIGTAYRQSSGDLICFLDADDTMHQSRLELLVRYFHDQPRAGIVCHELTMVDASGGRVGSLPFRTRLESGWIGDEVVRRGGRWSSMPGGGVCLRREVASLIFPLPEQHLSSYADSYITLLAPLLGEVGTIPKELYNYRIHDRNLMQRAKHDESITANIVRSIEVTTELANAELEKWGWSGIYFSTTNNLNYLQHIFLQSAFAGSGRIELIRAYWTLMKLLMFDDLYRIRDRVARVVIYGLAIPLPLRWRKWWLVAARSPEFYARRAKSFGLRLMRR